MRNFWENISNIKRDLAQSLRNFMTMRRDRRKLPSDLDKNKVFWVQNVLQRSSKFYRLGIKSDFPAFINAKLIKLDFWCQVSFWLTKNRKIEFDLFWLASVNLTQINLWKISVVWFIFFLKDYLKENFCSLFFSNMKTHLKCLILSNSEGFLASF